MGFIVKGAKSVIKAVGKVVKGVVGVVSKVVGGVFGFVVGGKKKATQSVSTLNKSLEPEASRKIIFGRTASPLDIRYWEVYGSQQQLFDEVIATATHKVNAFKELYLEQKLAIDAAGTIQPGFVGVLSRAVKVGETVGSISALSVGSGALWNGASSFWGCAHFVLKWNPDEKKLPGGIPARYTQVVEGALVYDPRRDSTRGGTGTHRANDRSTWEYATLDGNGQPIGRNNALQVLWYLLGWYITNAVTGEQVLVAGRGIDPEDINFASFIAGANACEAAGYYTDVVLATDDDHTANEDKITCSGLIGRVIDPGGLWSYYANVDDTANIAVELTDADILDNVQVGWNEFKGMSEQYNSIAGKYVNGSAITLYQAFPYPKVRDATYEANLGVKKTRTLDFEQVLDYQLAQRLARLKLNEGQYQGEFSAGFMARALAAQAWSIVRYTSDRFGWTKLFRVWRHDISTDGGVGMLLKEIHPSIWTAGTVAAALSQGQGSSYNPSQEIAATGLSIVQASITGPGTNPTIADGFRIGWTAPVENVRRTEVRYKVTGTTFWETVAPIMRGTATDVLIFPLVRGANYTVEIRHVSIHEVPGPWLSGTGNAGTAGNVTYAGIQQAATTADVGSLTDVATGVAPARTNVLTSLGTAAGISNQSPWATTAGYDPANTKLSGIDPFATSGSNIIPNAIFAGGVIAPNTIGGTLSSDARGWFVRGVVPASGTSGTNINVGTPVIKIPAGLRQVQLGMWLRFSKQWDPANNVYAFYSIHVYCYNRDGAYLGIVQLPYSAFFGELNAWNFKSRTVDLLPDTYQIQAYFYAGNDTAPAANTAGMTYDISSPIIMPAVDFAAIQGETRPADYAQAGENLIFNSWFNEGVDGKAGWAFDAGVTRIYDGNAPNGGMHLFARFSTTATLAIRPRAGSVLIPRGTKKIYFDFWARGGSGQQCGISGQFNGAASFVGGMIFNFFPNHAEWRRYSGSFDVPIDAVNFSGHYLWATGQTPAVEMTGWRLSNVDLDATWGADVAANVRDGGNGIVSRNNLLTSIGISSGIANQGPFATLDRARLMAGNGGIADQNNEFWVTNAHAITSQGTASGIANQSPWATTAGYNPANSKLGSIAENASNDARLVQNFATATGDLTIVGNAITKVSGPIGYNTNADGSSTAVYVHSAYRGAIRLLARHMSNGQVASMGLTMGNSGPGWSYRVNDSSITIRCNADSTVNWFIGGVDQGQLINYVDGNTIYGIEYVGPFVYLTIDGVVKATWATTAGLVATPSFHLSSINSGWKEINVTPGTRAAQTGNFIFDNNRNLLTQSSIVTTEGTASAIANQGAFATRNNARWVEDIIGAQKPDDFASVGDNFFSNPNFSSGAAGWTLPAGTSIAGGGAEPFYIHYTAQAQISSKITPIPAGASKLFLSHEMRTTAAGAQLYIDVVFLTESLANAGGGGRINNFNTPANVWTRITKDVTYNPTVPISFDIPPNASKVQIHYGIVVAAGETAGLRRLRISTTQESATEGANVGRNLFSVEGNSLNTSDVVTSSGTASAIANQGAFATLSAVDRTNTARLTGFGPLAGADRVRPTGDSVGGMADQNNSYWLTNSHIITGQGTASSIANQGAYATLNAVDLYDNTRISGDKPGRLVGRLLDTRASDFPPQHYMDLAVSSGTVERTEFKDNGLGGFPGSGYYTLRTITQWTDPSGGYPTQIGRNSSGEWRRVAVSGTAWGAWQKSYDKQNRPSFDDTDLVDGFGVVTRSAYRTGEGTASAIANQGFLATQSNFYLGTWAGAQRGFAEDGTGLNGSNTLTSRGTAAAIVNQGGFATKSRAQFGTPEIVDESGEQLFDFQVRNTIVSTPNAGWQMVTVKEPKGGAYAFNAGGVSGSLKIILPFLAPSTMIKFKLDIYDYNQGHSVTYIISGYPYGGTGEWVNTSVQYLGPDIKSLPVRFGMYKGKSALMVGDVSQAWSYPHFRVYDFSGHYSNQVKGWEQGWEVNLDTNPMTNYNGGTIAKPRSGDQVFGDNILEASGGAIATVSNFRTANGIASGIANQQAFATLDRARLMAGAGGIADENNAYWVTNAHAITSLGTASAIANQGALATLASVDLEGATVTNKSRISKLTQATGRVADPTIMNTQLIMGPRNATNLVPSYTVNATDVTISLPAHNRVVAGPNGPITISYGGGSGNWGFSAYWLAYIDDPNLAGNGAPAINFSNDPNVLLYPGRYQIASGFTPSSSGTGGETGTGGGSTTFDSCVDAMSYMDDGRQAFEFEVGDNILCIDYSNYDATVFNQITANKVVPAECVELTSASGIKVVISATTPCTLYGGDVVFATEVLGKELAVQDEAGYRWERIVETRLVGTRNVAHISCNEGTYAAGAEPGRFIFTHNGTAKP